MTSPQQPVVYLAPSAPIVLDVSPTSPTSLAMTTGGSAGAVTSVNGQTGAVTVSALSNPMTTLGDTIYGGTAGVPTRLAGDTSNVRKFLRELSVAGVAQVPAWDTLQAADVPLLGIPQGGTGLASLTAYALLAGGTTSTGALQQVSGLGTSGQVLTSNGVAALPTWQAASGGGFSNPMTTLGDMIYENSTPAAARLAGSTSATKNFLTQTGTGSVSAAPAWGTLAAADLPAATGGAQGAIQLAGDLGGTAASPQVVGTHLASPLPIVQGGTGSATRNFAGLLTPTAAKTGAYTAAAGDFVPCDTTTAAFTVTLPTAPADLTVIGVKLIKQGGTSAVTVAAGGTDVFNIASGATSVALALLNQGVLLQYKSSSAIWYVFADDLTLAQLDGRYVASVTAADTSVVVGGTAAAPTVRTNTLDVIAAQHPPAADWSNNSHKITSLANGGAAQDAAAWGQTVSGILTTLGDLVYENSTPAPARLAGNISATKNFLTQTGTGSVSAVPAWGTIAAGDLPGATTSVQGAVILDGTASDIKPTSTAAAAGSRGQAADASHVHVQNYGGVFGDGSDGSATFDGTTTVIGLVPASNVYTMVRDIFCTSITINSGVTLKTGGYRIFCAGTVTNNGTIGIGGNAGGATGTAGGSGPGGTLGGGKAGGAGATGNGSAGTNAATSPGCGAGGAGGGSGANTGGGGGTSGNSANTFFYRTQPGGVSFISAGALSAYQGAAGGGGGAGDGTNSGGGGGGGGPNIMIAAYTVNNGSGSILANGGAGGTPTAGNTGGGGGGGGGVIIVYTLSAWTAGTTNVAGGAAGGHAGTGVSGNAGNNGTVLNVVII